MQAAALIATESLEQRTSCLDREMDDGTSLEACRSSDNNVRSGLMSTSSNFPWGAAEVSSFCEEG